jgi:hypothetical protein
MKRSLIVPALLLATFGACKDNVAPNPVVAVDITASVSRAPDGAVTIPVGGTVQLTATTKGGGGVVLTDREVTWTSSNPGVAQVNPATGSVTTVTGFAPGSATITAQSEDARATTAVMVAEKSQFLTLNAQANNACSNLNNRVGRIVAVTDKAIVVVDTANPKNAGITDEDYRSFGVAFDTLAYPVNVDNFGTPSDIDGNGKVIIFYTRAVNELTPANNPSFVGGFFFGRDLFPRQGNARLQGCLGSNEAEMFYMLAPDPEGVVNGNKRSADLIRRATVGTIAHEFQHLINASRRLHINNATEFEEVWLNEGLSHIAEELVFYRVSRLAPRQNITIEVIRSSDQIRIPFNSYAISNFGRFISYLENPDTASLLGVGNLPTRGASWAFLRYAADRKPGQDQPFWFNLVNSTTRGVTNLRNVLGTDPINWMQDWTVSVYTDDAVPQVDGRFTQPSWHFRNIMPAFTSTDGKYPLKTTLLVDQATTSLQLHAGGAAFLRFGVGPSSRAEIRTTSGGAALPGSCSADGSARTLQVGEVLTAGPDAVGTLCVGGGAEGAEFTMVPFFASDASSARLALEITASGVRAVTGPPSPSWNPNTTGAPFSLSGINGLSPDRGFERRLRELEVRELGRMMPGAGISRTSQVVSSAASTPQNLRISIVRTK